jgi:hypothetical protein
LLAVAESFDSNGACLVAGRRIALLSAADLPKALYASISLCRRIRLWNSMNLPGGEKILTGISTFCNEGDHGGCPGHGISQRI